ncbi:MAG: ArsR/SmtB family transcription factor [Vicinamibacterales bacterium]
MTANAEAVISALSDPTRRAVFERLVDGPRSVADLASGLPVSRPAVSQHLKVLKGAGLVFDTRDGTRRRYQIDPAGVEIAWRYFDRFWGLALTAYKEAAERAVAHEEDNA